MTADKLGDEDKDGRRGQADGMAGNEEFRVSGEMAGKGSYVPPQYIPLYGLDTEEDRVSAEENDAARHKLTRDPTQWSSGICACFDDPQSCFIGATCPCFLFGRNAQFLGSGTLAGSCTTHCMLWGLLTSLCCVFTGGLVLAVPGSAVACYACGYRQALRAKYNLPEAPCGDLTTHLFCHLCAICQEYREIRERTDSGSSAPTVTPPAIQTMDEP
uniref:Cell number regulator 5 n=1 Tax=Oryza rufipogon TaxID=4529 RepID=A0A0E0MUE3_ORYRU